MVNLKDCISEVSNRPVVMRGETYVYFDTKETVSLLVINEAKTLQLQKEMMATFEEASREIKKMVQAEIEEYNKANALKYDDIDSLFKYTRNSAYTHYSFCVSVLDWNEVLWEKARVLQAQVLSGEIAMPTLEEFSSLLPTRKV